VSIRKREVESTERTAGRSARGREDAAGPSRKKSKNVDCRKKPPPPPPHPPKKKTQRCRHLQRKGGGEERVFVLLGRKKSQALPERGEGRIAMVIGLGGSFSERKQQSSVEGGLR